MGRGQPVRPTRLQVGGARALRFAACKVVIYRLSKATSAIGRGQPVRPSGEWD